MPGINPQTGLFDINYTAPQGGFGFGTPQVQAPSFGGFGMQTPQTASLNLSNVNLDPSNSINNFGFQASQPSIDPNNSLGVNPNLMGNVTPTITPQNNSFFGDMSGGDLLNFGSGLLQTGIGAYFANKQVDQAQQSLDLSQQKYDDYLADKANMDAVSANRVQTAQANSITGGS